MYFKMVRSLSFQSLFLFITVLHIFCSFSHKKKAQSSLSLPILSSSSLVQNFASFYFNE